MYTTFRKHASRTSPPVVIILSALHGFVSSDTVLSPYDQMMTADRSALMMSNIDSWMNQAKWPSGAEHILLAGGELYRRVMRLAIKQLVATGKLGGRPNIEETSGTIGVQRSQLGKYLRRFDV